MLTKTHEAFGRTTIEALSKGTPVIGYNSGAIPELISNEHAGSIFEIGDLKNICEELNKTYNYKKCFEFAQKYHVKNEIEGLLNKTRQILNNYG